MLGNVQPTVAHATLYHAWDARTRWAWLGPRGGGVKRTTVGLLTSFLISLARVCCLLQSLLLKYPLILYDFVIVLLAPLNPAAASSFLYDSSFCAIFGNYRSRGKIAAVDNTVKLPPLVSTYSQPPRSFLLVAVAARRLIIYKLSINYMQKKWFIGSGPRSMTDPLTPFPP